MPSRLLAVRRLAVLQAAAAGAAGWRDPRTRARARAAVRAVAGDHAGDALAVAHLAEEGARELLLRQPAHLADAPLRGAELLARAHAAGRGVLVSYCHFGPFPALAASLTRTLPRVSTVAGAWLADPAPDVIQPPRRHRWRAIFDAAGVELIDAENGAGARIREALLAGEAVTVTFDWPGSVETRFLGRPVWLASGSARLAAETGALVVPAMRRWRRGRPETVIAPPLDPRDLRGWRALHERLAAIHEHWIMRRPAALEDPRRPAAWGIAASAASWGAGPRHEQS